jgi:flagellar basal body P-ring formation protein FlgA
MMVIALVCTVLPAPTARAELRDMPVPLRNISAGEALRPELFMTKQFSVNAVALRNFASSRDQLAAKQAKRTLVAGKPIALSFVRNSDDIERGNKATAIYEVAGIQIQTILVAQENGSAGDVIDAKNPESGLIVKAMVRADGSLEIIGQ